MSVPLSSLKKLRRMFRRERMLPMRSSPPTPVCTSTRFPSLRAGIGRWNLKSPPPNRFARGWPATPVLTLTLTWTGANGTRALLFGELNFLILPPPHKIDREANQQPYCAEDLRLVAEVQPDKRAHHKPDGRSQSAQRRFLLLANAVIDEGGDVDAHERDEGAEVQQFRAFGIGKEERSGQSDGAEQEHVVARYPGFPIDSAEKAARKRVALAHSIQQARGALHSRDSGTRVAISRLRLSRTKRNLPPTRAAT